MKAYGMRKREQTEADWIKNGYYGCFSFSKRGKLGYKAATGAMKKRARRAGKQEAV